VVALFKAVMILGCSNSGIVGSNLARGMDVCPRLRGLYCLV
jgi:hypothetical protein